MWQGWWRRSPVQFWLAISLLSLLLAGQLGLLAKISNATYDEPIHILSGYATDIDGHVLFDPEHPFLAKAWSALPLLLIDITYPDAANHLSAEQISIDYDTLGEALQWGDDLLYTNQASLVLFLARVPLIVVSVGLLVSAAWWARRQWGMAAGLLTGVLFCFEPSLLAHGYLANNDVAAGLAMLWAVIIFKAWLVKPSWWRMVGVGVVLGLALLTKFSLLVLVPAVVILAMVWLVISYRQWWQGWQWQSGRTPVLYICQLAGAGIISLAIIWSAYGGLFWLNPSHNPWQAPTAPTWEGQLVSHIFPPMYAKGALNILPGIEPFKRTGYLLGQCYAGGKVEYFPTLLLTKTPLAVFGLWAVAVYYWWSKRRHLSQHDQATLLTLAIVVVVAMAISCLSAINIGFRHILPAYLLLVVWAGSAALVVDWHKAKKSVGTKSKATGLIIVVGCLIGSSLSYWPNYLAYYNELTGEYGRVVPYVAYDSNVDWGQSIKRLKIYMTDHGITYIALANFNNYAAAQFYKLPHERADPANKDYKGYIAVSRSKMIDSRCRAGSPANWDWLVLDKTPIAVIDHAYAVYKLE